MTTTEDIEVDLMIKKSLDEYDTRPKEMTNYLQYNGWHFNKKMCEFALSKMRKNGKPIIKLSKEQVDDKLKSYGVTLDNNQLWDYVYVYNFGKTKLFGNSIADDSHLARFVKDCIDDEDSYDGMPFTHWYADMCKLGIAIDWEEML